MANSDGEIFFVSASAEDETFEGTTGDDRFIFEGEASGKKTLFGVAGNNLFDGVGLAPTEVEGGPGSNEFRVGEAGTDLAQGFLDRDILILDFSATDLLRVEMTGAPSELRFGRDSELENGPVRPYDAASIFSREGSSLLFDTSGDAEWDYIVNFGPDSNFFSSTAADFRVEIRDLPAGDASHSMTLDPVESDRSAVFRFFNEGAGGHFFTANPQEMQNVHNNLPNFNHERVGFYAYADADVEPDAVPVYRFFNEGAGGHFFTPVEEEAQNVRDNLDNFRDEGIGFWAFDEEQEDTVPVYRFFNEAAGGHFFTPDEEEAQFVRNNLDNFIDEGIGFWAYADIA